MKKTQKERILDYMKEFGSITSLEAYSELGITQLGARLDQLKREGYMFSTELEKGKNRFGEKVNYKRYRLVV